MSQRLAKVVQETNARVEQLAALDYDDLDDTEESALTPEQAAELLRRAKARSGEHRLNLPPRRDSVP